MGAGGHRGGEVEPVTEVVNTLIGERVVVVLPHELGLDETLGVEGLHGLNDVEVLDVQVLMDGLEVLLGDTDALVEQVLVDLSTLVSRDQHLGFVGSWNSAKMFERVSQMIR